MATMNEVMAVTQPPEEHVAVLGRHFGLASFRGRQYDAIQSILEGQDTIVILPTGAGKSLTFQFPPHTKPHAFTVVIGPLLALMKDQVEKCLDLGLEAYTYNSEVSEEQRNRVISEVANDEPDMKLLYTTPESIRNPRLRAALQEAHQAGTLMSFAIDEAHCCSEWGNDFRPAYLELGSLKKDFPGCPVMALTASCTARVQTDIGQLLNLHQPRVIKASFNRPNIQYEVVYKELLGLPQDKATLEHLAAFIKDREGQGGIIYARLRATCDWLAGELGSMDVDVQAYHAGKDQRQRARVQREWSDGSINVVVATIAFGMGIDRGDVRWVVHWNAPNSMEGYYQESGRAGRDGLPSMALCYASKADLENAQKMERGCRSGSVASVDHFLVSGGCRRRKLLSFFGENRGPCGQEAGELVCDYCRDPQAVGRCIREVEKHQEQTSIAAAIRARVSGGAQGSVEEDGQGEGGDEQVQFPTKPLVQKGRGWASASSLPSTQGVKGPAHSSVAAQATAGHGCWSGRYSVAQPRVISPQSCASGQQQAGGDLVGGHAGSASATQGKIVGGAVQPSAAAVSCQPPAPRVVPVFRQRATGDSVKGAIGAVLGQKRPGAEVSRPAAAVRHPSGVASTENVPPPAELEIDEDKDTQPPPAKVVPAATMSCAQWRGPGIQRPRNRAGFKPPLMAKQQP